MSFLAELPRDRMLIDASLWSADLGALAAEVDRMTPHADLFHIDAADGHLVDTLLFSPAVVKALRPRTTVPFHVHLMAQRPARLAAQFADAGADLVTVHVEARGAGDAVRSVRDLGVAAGIALSLGSDPEAVRTFLPLVDAIVMVNTPLGTAGTGMDPHAPGRITAVRHILATADAPNEAEARTDNSNITVFADGGIRTTTVPLLADAGADALVAGSLLFGSADPATMAGWLHRRPRAAALPGRVR
ncbi:ribulose-phosphate 3-epimerase [Yinghuangia sp. ASG 101]|uniref:ribulose-phosphate 3-epimerase n=1 Tax=Yinghuangia sp. ASG 101 TaxID=2896848 RepID=UPI001E36159A|nr:ribulose-phosphate 3-epimerase [Yinghuangia sp. ASG 101]UGQ10499.1 ribulose-phosphate 3-epimerase [Yinghuangia sp. ASG 101]